MATIFTPQNPSPRNEVRDMLLTQPFTVTIDGVRCTDYQIIVRKVSDNTSVYDSAKVALGSPLSDGQTLLHNITGGTIPNTGTDSYKWTIQVWNDLETVTSREFQFFAKTTPVLTFAPPTTITSQSYEFVGSVAQTEGDIVNYYTMELYDSSQVFIESSPQITSFNIAYEFNGFVNGDDLYVRVYGQTTGGQTFDSGLVAFSVAYAEPSVNLKPDVVVDNYKGLVTTSRGEVVQIIGTSSGTISYVNDFIYTGNTAVEVSDSASYVDIDVDITEDFSLSFIWQPLDDATFDGKILQLDNGAYEVFYTLGRFGCTINGTTLYKAPLSLTDKIFYITLLPTKIEVKYISI